MNAKATTSRHVSGFTLVEMLMAMFILAIGLSAVVSVFYAAASLQRQAFDDVSAMQVARNTEALLAGRGIDEFWLVANGAFLHPNSAVATEWAAGQVVPLNPEMLRAGSGPMQRWPLPTRAYPQVDPFAAMQDVAPDPDAVDRNYYWVPLVRNASGTPGRRDWQVFVFILRKTQDSYAYGTPQQPDVPWNDFVLANPHENFGDDVPEGGFRPPPPNTSGPGTQHLIPGVWGLPASRANVTPPERSDSTLNVNHNGYINVGDRVLVGTGVTARVLEVTGNEVRLNTNHGVPVNGDTRIWIGAANSPRSSSPTRFILTLSGEVVR